MKLPIISVVITTHNTPEIIIDCITSVKNQTYSNIEIIVVDDVLIKENIYRKFIEKNARYFQDGPERSIKENRGVQEANGEFILIVDQDMKLSPNIIESCYNKLLQANLIGVEIIELSLGEGFGDK